MDLSCLVVLARFAKNGFIIPAIQGAVFVSADKRYKQVIQTQLRARHSRHARYARTLLGCACGVADRRWYLKRNGPWGDHIQVSSTPRTSGESDRALIHLNPCDRLLVTIRSCTCADGDVP
jgi:hypothetical protein